MYKVLEIGPDASPKAHAIWCEESGFDDVEITLLDANPDNKLATVFHEISGTNELPFDEGHFDAIFASHILEHIPYFYEANVVFDWKRVLKVGGELHVAVPSWEWVARQVLAEKYNAHLKPYAFGGMTTQWDVHLNMFTMQILRSLFAHCGLEVFRARTGPFEYTAIGEEAVAEQHYIAGRKPDEQNRNSTA